MVRPPYSGSQRGFRRDVELLFRPIVGTPRTETPPRAPSRRASGNAAAAATSFILRPPSTSPRSLETSTIVFNGVAEGPKRLSPLLSLKRMVCFFVKFVLQFQA